MSIFPTQARNILLITTDQQRYDALGCNGGTVARTPVLDGLDKIEWLTGWPANVAKRRDRHPGTVPLGLNVAAAEQDEPLRPTVVAHRRPQQDATGRLLRVRLGGEVFPLAAGRVVAERTATDLSGRLCSRTPMDCELRSLGRSHQKDLIAFSHWLWCQAFGCRSMAPALSFVVTMPRRRVDRMLADSAPGRA